jgi:8-oxo-dGTP pyrophosphatase MutT (NUDIX family)
MLVMNKTTNVCNNCGKQGHIFNQCKMPIVSYGIVLFRSSLRGIEYLMIRRKDSFGYIDFIRGKYSPYNISQIQELVNQMSVYEKQQILNENFVDLWNKMWGETSNIQYKSEEIVSSKKIDTIRAGVNVDGVFYNLKSILDNSNTSWKETEWEFPKGRRNNKEKDLDCALREFEEETGMSKEKIIVVENIIPFEEIFLGTNHKSYKHKYFLAYTNETDSDSLYNFQVTEVSKLEWKTLDECLLSIRPYNLEKKDLIININKVLQEYRLYT